MRALFLLIFALLWANALSARIPEGVNGPVLNGFAEKVAGQDFNYHSSVPDARECLLTRATDGHSFVEWKTAPVPVKSGKTQVPVTPGGNPLSPLPGEGTITFAWLAGIGSSPGNARFDLSVNGRPLLSFWSDGKDEWSVEEAGGATLSFRKEMTDQYGDKFGFMFLTVPASGLVAGEPLHIRVTGGNFGKTSWYMTFKFPLKSGFSFKALPAVIHRGEESFQAGMAQILHFGEPATARLIMGRKITREIPVRFGYNQVSIDLPQVSQPSRMGYRLELAGKRESGEILLSPVRKWRVNFVQHSHTDIGYTRPQTEILAEHLRYIDYALDYCDLTDGLPEEARFRWSCEASWAVDEYLKCRPSSKVERLRKRVAEKRIEITGMYFNFDELPGEQVLAASLAPLKRFREAGLEVKTAMQNDVNGIGWCLSEFFPGQGIRYLHMGTHGHRALICFDKPTLFWWESPSGKRMLAFRAEHYMLGNTLFRIHAGDFGKFEEELLSYLSSLEAKGYPWELISIQHSGYLTDNAPPSTLACEMIRQWNEKYSWPKLQTATATQFFEEMEADHGKEFPVIRGAWPDWWTDGFGASAREVAAVRTAAADLVGHTAGMSMAALLGAQVPGSYSGRVDATNEALLFYTEHTVGYHGSVSEPFHKNSMEQRALKESYAWEAARRAKMTGEMTLGLLQSHFSREKEPSLLVFNTLSFPRSGVVTVYADHQIIPRYTDFTLTTPDGKDAKAQPLENFSDGTTWALWVDSIPAFGFRKYTIRLNEKPSVDKTSDDILRTSTFENQWYALRVDTLRAAIAGLYDKTLSCEILDPKAPWMGGEFIYEILGNRAQMEAFKLDNFHRETPANIRFDGFRKGEIWNTFFFRGNTPAAMNDGDFRVEIRVFNTAPRIDLVYDIHKKLVTDPEGIYIAFPFHLDKGQLAFDVAGGEIRAGIDQIPGSANDWNTVQSYARLYNDLGQIVLSSPEIPLMQFGGIHTGRYRAGALPETTHIFGWPMNNYWTTNFNAYQFGGHTWSYSMTGISGNRQEEAARAGQSLSIPFLARLITGVGTDAHEEGRREERTAGSPRNNLQEARSVRQVGSFISGWPENLLLISMNPDKEGKSALLHLRETAGKSAVLNLRNEITRTSMTCTPAGVNGEIQPEGTLTIKPYESRFFRVEF
ncbi:MAG TPA: hypothetical protein PK489_08975 [Prolixibacteraceae bacterium]|nr:hypothetical protein [Prolixibacteraceae bacterium]